MLVTKGQIVAQITKTKGAKAGGHTIGVMLFTFASDNLN